MINTNEYEKLMNVIKKRISETVGLMPEEIEEDQSFLKMGISSIHAIKIINLIQKDLGIELNPAIIFEYETLEELVDYLLSEGVKVKEELSEII